MRLIRFSIFLSAALILFTQVVSAEEEINVALARYGATAFASSEFNSDYSALNAIDGRWQSRESDKWNTADRWDGGKPHWLLIDLKQERTVEKIVIRHEGVVADGDRYDTSDYRLQEAAFQDGPWTDIVPPVTGNTDDVTVHEFSPRKLRYIRLFITKGEQKTNDWGRIFEVEVYSPLSTIDAPLASVGFDQPFKRKAGDGFEVKAYLEAAIPEKLRQGGRIAVKNGGETLLGLDAAAFSGQAEFWAPVPGKGATGKLDIVYVKDGSEHPVNTIEYSSAKPGYFADGTVYVISSSHQDIGWMNTPEICIRDRDLKVITPALELLKKNPKLCFSVETSLQLMEYLDRHPERKEEIIRLTKSGQLEWGATYHQPYESMYPGESLIRQVYLGRKWLKKTLPGCDTRLAWNPDVPARAMQMPQILAKAGIPYLFMSRHEEGFYKWLSPDGSGVIAYSPGHYHASGTIFREGIEHGEDGTTIIIKYRPLKDAAAKLTEKLGMYDEYYREHGFQPRFGVVMSTDFSGPVEIDGLMGRWNAMKSDPQSHFTLPRLRYSTGEQFYEAFSEGSPRFDSITGERPNVWLYIHGPTHHKAMDACREAGWVLPAAETFATVDAALSGSFTDYPANELFEAWRRAIYPDHGWGGKNGHVTDRVFREAFEKGRDMGRDILERSQRSISEQVMRKREGVPITVFNHLSWARTAPVECDLSMFGAESAAFEIVDADGASVPHQVIAGDSEGFAEDNTLRVLFVARDVPPVGYAVYYAVPRETVETPESPFVTGGEFAENDRYLIEFAPGGLKRLYDRKLGKQILNSEKFAGGELFTMHSEGNGAGEFADVQQPDMEGFDRSGAYGARWTLVENGPVRVTYECTQPFGHVTSVQRISLYDGVDRIDFGADLLGFDGAKNREFRLAFPLDMDNAAIAYNVPMGAVEVGKSEIAGAAGERYTTNCSEVHPREVIDWFSASDGDFGVTISSSVAVFDWIDPTDKPVDYPILQPILLASRKSCHWEGNWYLQTGDHRFRFSLFSHEGDWREGWKASSSAAQPITAVVGGENASGGNLPERMSFASVDADNVYISTIKKCDDDDSVIVRLCEIEGHDADTAIRWFGNIGAAERTNLIEEEGRALGYEGKWVPVTVGHHAIETYKLVPAGKR